MKSIFKNIKTLSLMLFLVSLIFACKSETKTPDEKPAEQAKTDELMLSDKQMETVGITIAPLEKKNLTAVVKVNGELAVPPQNRADLSVLAGGIIRKIYVLEGQQVKKGQVLASIENQELIRIQQDYLTAKNSFSYIKAEYDRQQKLKDAEAGTGKSFQAAQATFNAERAKINAYESQLSQLGISANQISKGNIVSQFPVKSPINGTVGQITANTGTFIQPGTSIMAVVDNSKIHCDLIVFEKDLLKVKIGQTVNFILTNQAGQKISGKINGINKSFEDQSKGVVVHAVINNSAQTNLIPGMYVTALINVGNDLTLAVPKEAVVRSEGKEYVFLVDEEQKEKSGSSYHFKKAEVKTGVSELGYVQITPISSLKEGDKIANTGAFYLLSKSLANAEEE